MKEQKFEAAMKRLEEIADMLESGSKSLEESISLFEEGSELAKLCSEKLDQAETKIQILTKENKSFKLSDRDIQ